MRNVCMCECVNVLTQFSDSFEVYQGERCIAQRNKFIGVFTMNNLPDGPPGRSLDFKLSIDENGVLSVRAKLRSTKSWQSCTLRVEGLSATDIITNVEDAERYREEDRLELGRIKARAKVNLFLYNMIGNVSPEDQAEYSEAKEWMRNNLNASAHEFELKLHALQGRFKDYC